jgi:hypothetical protein
MENGKQPILDNQFEDNKGLTKREYFAGLAMQGVMASLTAMRVSGNSTLNFAGADEDVAREAVSIADALLKELDKTRSK